MLLEFLNICKFELNAGMPLIQLMNLKWGSPFESQGATVLCCADGGQLFYEDTYCGYPANLWQLPPPCATAAVRLLFYSF